MVSALVSWLVALIISIWGPVLSLNSVKQIDDYPLYTMHAYGDYDYNVALTHALGEVLQVQAHAPAFGPAWGCSLFAAFADPGRALYGRNFDWEYSPALLLFTHPPDGYDSVAMVDIAYLGFGSHAPPDLITMPLTERASLVFAPYMPFDGMNEHGLAIGIAAVPSSAMPDDPAHTTLGSLEIVREVLDHARTVDEALAIFEQHNIDFTGGPPLHYLIADAGGHSALIEYLAGELVIQRNQTAWDMATNFIRASVPETQQPENRCWRYRAISRYLADRAGRLTPNMALALLDQVAQNSTQWSVVYHMATGDVYVAMGGDLDTVHTFHLPLASPGAE
jgi:hypothetical protein